jgi:mannose-1-phosphate guanylyltransferase
LRKIQDFGGFFDETTLVLCGDAIVDLDIGAALAEHRAKGAMASVIVKEVPRESVGSYGVVETSVDGRIRSFQEKPSRQDAHSNLASTGIYILEPAAIALIPPDRPFDIGNDLFPMLVEADLAFYAQRHTFNWIDIGKITDCIDVTMQLIQRPVAGPASRE